MILIGLSADAEATAEKVAGSRDPEKRLQLTETYHTLMNQFFDQRQEVINTRNQEVPCDVVTFLGPELIRIGISCQFIGPVQLPQPVDHSAGVVR